MANKDTQDLSPDDALEKTRGSSSKIAGNNPLPEDNDTPSAPSTDSDGYTIASDHQALDARSNIDSHEEYDEGTVGAAEAGEDNSGHMINQGG